MEVEIPPNHKCYVPFIEYTIKHDMDHDLWDEEKSANVFIEMLDIYKNDL